MKERLRSMYAPTKGDLVQLKYGHSILEKMLGVEKGTYGLIVDVHMSTAEVLLQDGKIHFTNVNVWNVVRGSKKACKGKGR